MDYTNIETVNLTLLIDNLIMSVIFQLKYTK